MTAPETAVESETATGLFTIDQAASLLAAIVASSADAIVSKTADGIITSWNMAAEHLFGYAASEMIGQSIRRLIPAELQAEEDNFLSRIAAGERIGNYETVRIRKDGGAIDVSVTISPVRDQTGTVIGASKIARDITEKKRGEKAEALLAAIVTSSSDPIISTTLDGIITSWNAAAEHLFGYSPPEIIGQPIRRLVPLEHQEEDDRILSRIAAGERVSNYETARMDKDGRIIDVSVTISSVRDHSGAVTGASRIIRDITEKKQAAEQIHLLLSEVNHRGKNLLGVVQAIARQTFTFSPENYLPRFLERLQALSASQDVLMRNTWRGIQIEDLIDIQLAAFKDLFGTRISKHGPGLELVPAAAQTLGLALHELLTNASKYGALSNDRGRIDIIWRQEGNQLFIDWSEHNGPPAKTPDRNGFGSTVISDIVKASMNAKVTMDYAHSGFTWSVECPANKVLVMTTHQESE